MIDVKLPVRKAFYDLLSTAPLSYGGNYVPVYDDVKALSDPSNPYVLLSNQDGQDVSTFQTFDTEESIVLDIAFKAMSRSNKEVVDNVAGQILPLVMPAPGSNGLITGPEVIINCVRLTDDRYLTLGLNTSNSIVRRLLTFKMRVRQTGSSTPTPPIPGFQNPVTSNMFATPTQYVNGNLKGRTFLLYLNGSSFLTLGTDWNYMVDGGFEIFLNNFNAQQNSYTFYVLLD